MMQLENQIMLLSIAAVMLQWILDPIKTGSNACAYSVQLLLGSFRGYYILS